MKAPHFQLVRRLLLKSDHEWAHHVAIATRGGVTVAVGYNKGEMHAEEMAVRKLRLSGETANILYSIRIRRDGRPGASRPCAKCERLCRSIGIRYVYYADYDGSQTRMLL